MRVVAERRVGKKRLRISAKLIQDQVRGAELGRALVKEEEFARNYEELRVIGLQCGVRGHGRK